MGGRPGGIPPGGGPGGMPPGYPGGPGYPPTYGNAPTPPGSFFRNDTVGGAGPGGTRSTVVPVGVISSVGSASTDRPQLPQNLPDWSVAPQCTHEATADSLSARLPPERPRRLVAGRGAADAAVAVQVSAA